MALSSCFHYRPCTISQPTHSSTFPISILGSVNLTIYLAIGNKRSAKIRNSRRTEQQLKSQIIQTHLLRVSREFYAMLQLCTRGKLSSGACVSEFSQSLRTVKGGERGFRETCRDTLTFTCSVADRRVSGVQPSV